MGPTGNHSGLVSPKPALVTDLPCLLLSTRADPQTPNLQRRLTAGREGCRVTLSPKLWLHTARGLAYGAVGLILRKGKTH